MDKSKEALNIFLRYVVIFIAGLGNLYFFYQIMTPLTLRGSFFLINLFFKASIQGNFIFLQNKVIQFVPACIAGSAYYLLFILIFSTPKLSKKQRILAILLSFSMFYLINILRITLFSFLNQSLFEKFHFISFYFLSTLFVISIWLFLIKILNINHIPIYEDIKILYSLTKKIKKSKR